MSSERISKVVERLLDRAEQLTIPEDWSAAEAVGVQYPIRPRGTKTRSARDLKLTIVVGGSGI